MSAAWSRTSPASLAASSAKLSCQRPIALGPSLIRAPTSCEQRPDRRLARRRHEGHRDGRAGSGLLRHRRVSGRPAPGTGDERHGDHLPNEDGGGGRGRERPEARPDAAGGPRRFGVECPRQPRPAELSGNRSSPPPRLRRRQVREPERARPRGLAAGSPRPRSGRPRPPAACRARRRSASRRSDCLAHRPLCAAFHISTRRLRRPGVPSRGTLPRQLLVVPRHHAVQIAANWTD